MHKTSRWFWWTLLLPLSWGCGSDVDGKLPAGTGGVTASGGHTTIETGGAAATGGLSNASGGATGGATSASGGTSSASGAATGVGGDTSVVLADQPFVEIQASVDDRTVTLTATGSSPLGQDLTYSWSQPATNPSQLLFAPATGTSSSVSLPAGSGEYTVRVTATDEEGRAFSAARILTANAWGVTFHTADHHAAWIDDLVLYEVNAYDWVAGGDVFAQLTTRLDDLTALGINGIWLTPIFEGGGLGYHTTNYYALQSFHGSEASFDAFVTAAHDRGVRVLLDAVFNHTSRQHPFFLSCLSEASASPYSDYYLWDGAVGGTSYDFDFLDDDDEGLPNLDVTNAEVATYLEDVAMYWLTQHDIDGFRCDAAWAPHERESTFWQGVAKRVKNVRPDAFLLAEADSNEATLFDDAFASAYDWTLRPFAWTHIDHGLPGLLHDDTGVGNESIDDLHAILSRAHPERALPLRFIENHDLPRAAGLFGEARSKLAHALIFTVPGIPLLYGGAEMGQTETYAGITDFSDPLVGYFEDVIAIRRAHIRNDATLVRLPNDNAAEVYAYATISGDSVVVSVLNFAGNSHTSGVDLSALEALIAGPYQLEDLLTAPGATRDLGSSLTTTSVTTAAYGVEVFLLQGSGLAVTELVANGDFSANLTDWYSYIDASAAAEQNVSAGVYGMSITNGGAAAWTLQLLQDGIALREGVTYEVSLLAHAAAARTINVALQENDGSSYPAYASQQLDLTTTPTTYRFGFTMAAATDLSARLAIEMGNSGDDVYLDAISVTATLP